MLSYFAHDEGAHTLPHRAPGSPGKARQFLSGKPIRYYRPKGSQEVRHLIDEGFQAFNAGRLSGDASTGAISSNRSTGIYIG